MSFKLHPRACFIACALAATLVIPRASQAQSFNDVPLSHWAYAFIEQMLARGITAGCGGGGYCPDGLTFQSSTDGAGCSNFSTSWPTVWPALPNDPGVTGVSMDSFALPIQIDY